MNINPKQLNKILEIAIPKKEPIIVVGTPGIGKTDILVSVANKLNANLVISHPVTCDPTDYKGFPFATFNKEKNRDEAHFLPFGDLQKLIDANKLTICFFDDFGQSPPSVQAAIMQLVLSRRINGFHVSDDVVFVAATNRKQDKAGVSGILEPVKSRFTILNLIPDLDSWCEWAILNDLNPCLIQFIRYRPSLLNDFKPTPEIANCSNPRTIATVSRHLSCNYGSELEYIMIAGAAGEGFATEFSAFQKIYGSLPDADEILKNPKKAKIPKELAQLYALAGAIAYRTTKDNFNKVCELIERLPVEFGVMLMKDVILRIPEIVSTKEFGSWAIKNKDFLI